MKFSEVREKTDFSKKVNGYEKYLVYTKKSEGTAIQIGFVTPHPGFTTKTMMSGQGSTIEVGPDEEVIPR